MRRKGTAPLSPKKNEHEYSTHTSTTTARNRIRMLQGVDLILHRAKAADRKAKFKALAKLRASEHYTDMSLEEKKTAEQEVEFRVKQQRDGQGISLQSIEGNIMREMAEKELVGKQNSIRQLEYAIEQKHQKLSTPIISTKTTLAQKLAERTRQRLRRVIRKHEWIIAKDGPDWLKSAEDPDPNMAMKKFKLQALEPEELLGGFHNQFDESLPGDDLFIDSLELDMEEIDEEIISINDEENEDENENEDGSGYEDEDGDEDEDNIDEGEDEDEYEDNDDDNE